MKKTTWAAAATGLTLALVVACGDSDDDPDGDTDMTSPATYALGVQVIGDPNVAFIKLFTEFPTGEIALDDAIEIGPVFPYFFDGRVFGLDQADGSVTRYRIDGLNLVEDGSIGFGARGGAGELFFVSSTRAFAFNATGREYIEFDPSAETMMLGNVIDVSIVDDETLGSPTLWRRSYVRPSDNTHFSSVSYEGPVPGLSLDTTYIVAANLDTGATTLIRDDRCGASTAFGLRAGHIDENNDFYFLVDAELGLPTILGVPGLKDPCVIRINDGELAVDDTFLVEPRTATSGRFGLGLIPVGDGQYLTSQYDVSGIAPEDALQAFTDAVGEYWIIDSRDGSMRKLEIPEGDLAAFSVNVDGRTMIVRDVPSAADPDVIQSALFEVDPAAETLTEVLRSDGFPWFFARL
ncbi:MAG: hypothetical protein AAFP04_03570 [Myxococcota bacterium]